MWQVRHWGEKPPAGSRYSRTLLECYSCFSSIRLRSLKIEAWWQFVWISFWMLLKFHVTYENNIVRWKHAFCGCFLFLLFKTPKAIFLCQCWTSSSITWLIVYFVWNWLIGFFSHSFCFLNNSHLHWLFFYAGTGVLAELGHLMSQVADEASGAGSRQWQHPSDLTRRYAVPVLLTPSTTQSLCNRTDFYSTGIQTCGRSPSCSPLGIFWKGRTHGAPPCPFISGTKLPCSRDDGLHTCPKILELTA